MDKGSSNASPSAHVGKPTATESGAPSAAQERWDLGPWENGYRQIWTPSGAPFQATVVAHVFGGDLRRDRLIAAAPELLAALIRVVAVADRQTEDFDAARAAIARATGQ